MLVKHLIFSVGLLLSTQPALAQDGDDALHEPIEASLAQMQAAGPGVVLSVRTAVEVDSVAWQEYHPLVKGGMEDPFGTLAHGVLFDMLLLMIRIRDHVIHFVVNNRHGFADSVKPIDLNLFYIPSSSEYLCKAVLGPVSCPASNFPVGPFLPIVIHKPYSRTNTIPVRWRTV